MPSPLGHALGALAAGSPALPRRTLAAAAILCLVGSLPDLDLVFGVHRGASHSLGAAVMAGVAAWMATRRGRWGVAVALAWASHVGLDWLGNDTRPPIGVMALWPFTHEYYKAAVEIFPPVSRRYWESRFWLYNLRAVVAEVLILTPVTLIVLGVLRRRGRAVVEQRPD